MGLEALDTLRMETGLIFSGHEFCGQTGPFKAGIGFCVPLETKADDFMGRAALTERSTHPQRKLAGLVLHGNEAAAHGDGLFCGRAQTGVVTSATRPPLTGRSIALCRVAIGHAAPGALLEVGKLDGQQKRLPATVTAPVFYDPDQGRVRS